MSSNGNLSAQYQAIRQQTLQIVKPLRTEDYVVQPIVDVSPPKWHLAHSSWFFENFILRKFYKNYKVFNDQFCYLFNSYYESVGERVQRHNRGNLTRPTVEEVMKYRTHVDEHMLELLEKDISRYQEFLLLGLNHEQQHQELLVTDIKFILGRNPLLPVYSTNAKHRLSAAAKGEWINVQEGNYEIGYSGSDFCFDNERGQHSVFLHGYRIMSRTVTNGEYLEFMEAGGYERPEFWLMDGWEWRKQHGIVAPEYWIKDGKNWNCFTLNGVRRIDPNEPVTHVSLYEADAFARFRGFRLPTEFEWEVAAGIHEPVIHDSSNVLEKKTFHPVAPASGNYHFIGNQWEWTNSAYLPYPFYKQGKGALGEYNGKFMINQMVLRGGSCATPLSHIRHTYRNFFQPDKRWQFSGIRLAAHL